MLVCLSLSLCGSVSCFCALSLSLSVGHSSLFLSNYLPTYLFIHLPICLSSYLSIYLSYCLSVSIFTFGLSPVNTNARIVSTIFLAVIQPPHLQLCTSVLAMFPLFLALPLSLLPFSGISIFAVCSSDDSTRSYAFREIEVESVK